MWEWAGPTSSAHPQAYVETTQLQDHQAWCEGERHVAEQHAAGFETIMTAHDLEQAVVDSVVADLDRLTQGANMVQLFLHQLCRMGCNPAVGGPDMQPAGRSQIWCLAWLPMGCWSAAPACSLTLAVMQISPVPGREGSQGRSRFQLRDVSQVEGLKLALANLRVRSANCL